ncbi:MAG TPA: hypothetical protein VFI53_13485 [Myxococcaceae bacterium]|nr:hypothetical protein [Myxococcaceae bacterium]
MNRRTGLRWAALGLGLLAACQSSTSVSGKVSGAVGVEISLTGPTGGTSVTGRDGTFSFTGLPSGTYSLTPSLSGFSFEPASRTIGVDGSPVNGLDFTASGQSGVLDTVFGDGGTEVVEVAGAVGNGTAALALQPDGRMLLVGTTWVQSTPLRSTLYVHRLLPDGRTDPAFGANGGAAAGDGARFCSGTAVAVQTDGKVLAAGGCNSNSVPAGGQGALLLVRFEVDGGLDDRFGAGGIVLTPIGLGAAVAKAVALLPDGSVVVSGYAEGAGLLGSVAVARYDSQGKLDPSFGDAGTVVTLVGTSCTPESMALQNDGSVVVAGGAFFPDAGQRMFVARYTSRGMLDPEFGIAGISIAPTFPIAVYPSNLDTAYAVAVQGDGKPVAAGAGSLGGLSTTVALARWTDEGSMDPTFGGAPPAGPGTVSAYFGGLAHAIALPPDGKILTGGTVQGRFLLMRWNTDGTPDPSFGNGSPVLTMITGADQIFTLAVQPDGKIVAAGESSGRFSVARYWP